MPTLQDILSQNDPEALKKLLGRNSSSVDDQPMEDASAIPTPGPTPIPEATPAPSIPTPIGMGPLSNPDDYKPSVMNEYAPEEESPSSMIPDQRSSMSMSSQVRSQQPASVSADVSRSPTQEGFTENTVENLKKAQAEAARLKNFEDLNNTATILAGAAAGERHRATPTNVDELVKIGEQKKKDADSIVKDFQARGEQEKNDPGSAASAQARSLARAMMKQAGLGINIPDNVSAADLEKRFPQLQHMATSKQALDERRDLMSLKREELATNKESARNDKLDKEFDSNVIKFNANLDKPELSGARSAAGKNVLISQYADRINTLVKSAPKGDYNNLTNQQVYEIAKSLDAMLSLGAPTVAGTKEITPSSIQSILAGYSQKASNAPAGAQLGKFVENIKDTIDREKKLADKQISDFYEVAKQGIPERQYKARQSDYDRTLQSRLARIATSENPKAVETLAQVQQSKATPSDMVKVISPDGKSGSIPKDKLQEALKRGYKEVK